MLEQVEDGLARTRSRGRRSSAISTTSGDEHDDRVVDDLGPGRPGHLAQLAADLADELARAWCAALGGLRRRARLRRARGGGRRRRRPAGPGAAACASSLGSSPWRDVPAAVRTASRAGGTRTPNRRFWRPVLCQLSYCPLGSRAGCRWLPRRSRPACARLLARPSAQPARRTASRREPARPATMAPAAPAAAVAAAMPPT